MLTWAIILVVLAASLFVVELFVPSGGVLGVLSTGCLIGAVVCLFGVSPEAGIAGVLAAVVIIPMAIALALKVFPTTPIGRLLILGDKQPSGAAVTLERARDEDPAALVGATGETVTHMRPVGICRFGDRRLECISETGVIDPGRRVVVTAVRGIEVRVRPV